jgi:uncharacterized protein (TIGR01319 family)
MTEALALVDFGSTFTKVTLVDPAAGRVVRHGQAPTTVGSDVMEGFRAALEMARGVDGEFEVTETMAASSAAGGLRVTAVGIVADLTAAAAKQAALNAGARVELTLAGKIGPAEIEAAEKGATDILLFAGGTNGGQRERVLENAGALAGAAIRGRVVVACNEDVAARVGAIFEAGGKRVDLVANVMPEMFELDVEPARAAIARLFVEHVIGGKGLSADPDFSRMVKMPTPEAVLRATRVLSAGAGDVRGEGDVVVVDVGGATTDIHSVTNEDHERTGLSRRILPILPVLRTVQGDLGVRWNATGVVEADGPWLAEALGVDKRELVESAGRRADEPNLMPQGESQQAVDRALASSCVMVALRRHVGEMVTYFRPNDMPRFSITGPDLREVSLVVGTGGSLVHAGEGEATIGRALERRGGRLLTPTAPRIALDASYVLSAAGLLAGRDPVLAARITQAGLRFAAQGADRSPTAVIGPG